MSRKEDRVVDLEMRHLAVEVVLSLLIRGHEIIFLLIIIYSFRRQNVHDSITLLKMYASILISNLFTSCILYTLLDK